MTDAVKVVDTPTADESAQATAAEEISVPRAITIEVEGPAEHAVSAAETEMLGPAPAGEPTADVEKALRDRRSRAQIKTARLDSRDFRPSWPIAIAALEQLSGWGVLALRLGTLALIQQCVRELAEEKAHADTVARLRALTDALAHMPLEI
jgi:hypothetical protein